MAYYNIIIVGKTARKYNNLNASSFVNIKRILKEGDRYINCYKRQTRNDKKGVYSHRIYVKDLK